MEKKILMSIMTKYSNKIFEGTKKWEFRKNLPKINESDELIIVVYSSKEKKAIIGEFKAGRILKCSFEDLMLITENSNDEKAINWFKNYYKNKTECCAIEILNPIEYTDYISLDNIQMQIPNFKAPQNFIYIKEKSELDKTINSVKVKKR